MQIRTIPIGYEAFKRKFEPFERELKYDNSNLNTSNEIRSIWRLLLTIRKGFKEYERKF